MIERGRCARGGWARGGRLMLLREEPLMRRAPMTNLAILLIAVGSLFANFAGADLLISTAEPFRSTAGGLLSTAMWISSPLARRAETDAASSLSTPQRRRAVQHPRSGSPQANADAYTVGRGKTLMVGAASGVLANDIDPRGKPLTAILVTSPAHGTLTLNPDGSFTYVNDSSPATTDSFTYKASNGTSESSPATVTITITADNPPVAVGDSYTLSQDMPLITPAPGVLANDTLNGATIASYGASSGAEQTSLGIATATTQGGSVALNADGGFSFNPASGFAGTDTFKYVLKNLAGSSTATVTLTIIATPPVASPDSYSTPRGTALSVPAPGVLANDTLNGATIASYGASTGSEQTSIGASTATAQGGSVILNADGSFRYNPASTFTGNDTFKYVIRNAGGSSTATVTIAVQAPPGPDFVVTTPGGVFAYSISPLSGQNPVLTLTRGRTYTFQINSSSIHPFEILNTPSGSVTNNNISNGTLTFKVPTTAQNYSYHCSIHGFGNTIQTVP